MGKINMCAFCKFVKHKWQLVQWNISYILWFCVYLRRVHITMRNTCTYNYYTFVCVFLLVRGRCTHKNNWRSSAQAYQRSVGVFFTCAAHITLKYLPYEGERSDWNSEYYVPMWPKNYLQRACMNLLGSISSWVVSIILNSIQIKATCTKFCYTISLYFKYCCQLSSSPVVEV
jgi:hypothetical protein